MITKAKLLERARAQGLLPKTVEKDYVLGWVLAAISVHARLSTWVFKGGTCLKKCFFETYRFSEDLEERMRDDPVAPGRMTRAYLSSVLDLGADGGPVAGEAPQHAELDECECRAGERCQGVQRGDHQGHL